MTFTGKIVHTYGTLISGFQKSPYTGRVSEKFDPICSSSRDSDQRQKLTLHFHISFDASVGFTESKKKIYFRSTREDFLFLSFL